MKEKIFIDGVEIVLKGKDFDGDGVTGGIEYLSSDNNTTAIITPTELGESLKELNTDTIEKNTRMSGIDMRSRLHHQEACSILALDALVTLQVLPSECIAFTRQKKRLSVSIDGKGRQEIVDIVGGKREHDKDSVSPFRRFFGGGQQSQEVKK